MSHNQSFESNLKALEQLLISMENPELPLEEKITQFEKGSLLLTACRAQLGSLEQKIEQLSAGEFKKIEIETTPPNSPRKTTKKIKTTTVAELDEQCPF